MNWKKVSWFYKNYCDTHPEVKLFPHISGHLTLTDISHWQMEEYFQLLMIHVYSKCIFDVDFFSMELQPLLKNEPVYFENIKEFFLNLNSLPFSSVLKNLILKISASNMSMLSWPRYSLSLVTRQDKLHPETFDKLEGWELFQSHLVFAKSV